MLSLPNGICSYNYKYLKILFRFYNNLPSATVVMRFYDPRAFDDVRTVGPRMLKHSPQIDFVEAAVLHPFQQVWSELEFPFLPLRPR
jgi:hypothetical protein